MLFHVIRTLVMSLALFPPAFSLLVHGFDQLYGPPAVLAPAKSYRSSRWQGWEICGTPRGLVRDDACRVCRPEEMTWVELRVETGTDAQGGHAFLHTPNETVGFRAKLYVVDRYDYLNPLAVPVPGYLLDDSQRPYHRVKRYRVCPKTLQRLTTAIRQHASDPYQLGNWRRGRNCATWASDRLRDAGLTPPPGDCPNRMAWYLEPVTPVDERPTFGVAATCP